MRAAEPPHDAEAQARRASLQSHGPIRASAAAREKPNILNETNPRIAQKVTKKLDYIWVTNGLLLSILLIKCQFTVSEVDHYFKMDYLL